MVTGIRLGSCLERTKGEWIYLAMAILEAVFGLHNRQLCWLEIFVCGAADKIGLSDMSYWFRCQLLSPPIYCTDNRSKLCFASVVFDFEADILQLLCEEFIL